MNDSLKRIEGVKKAIADLKKIGDVGVPAILLLEEQLRQFEAQNRVHVDGDVEVGRDFVGRDNITNINFGIHPLSDSSESIAPEDYYVKSYYRKLANQCNILPLERIYNTDLFSSGSPKTVPMESVYTDLEVVQQSTNLRQPKVSSSGLLERLPLIKVISDPHATRVIILGDAGSGKTTFVNYITYTFAKAIAEGQLENLPISLKSLYPVRILLRNVVSCMPEKKPCSADLIWDSLRKDIDEKFGRLGFKNAEIAFQKLGDKISRDGALFLLDGLDEVPAINDLRSNLIEAIRLWLTSLDQCNCRAIITARPYAYSDPSWQLDDFDVYALAPFSDIQISNFIRHWYKSVRTFKEWNENTTNKNSDQLIREIQEHTYLRKLASRPLLLTLIAAVKIGGGKLPEDRARLLEQAIELLLSRWPHDRSASNSEGEEILDQEENLLKDMPDERKREALEALAFYVHDKQRQKNHDDESSDITIGDISQIFVDYTGDISPKVLIRFLKNRVGFLIERTENIYTFPHRSFQEYLAGCNLTSFDNLADKMRELIEQDNEWWREVCLLAAGKRSQGGVGAVSSLLKELLFELEKTTQMSTVDWYIAIMCGLIFIETRLNEDNPKDISTPRNKIKRSISNWLQLLLEQNALPVTERVEAGDMLALIGDPRFNIQKYYLPNDSFLGFLKIPEGEFIMGLSESQLETLIKDHSTSRDDFKEFTPQLKYGLNTFYMARFPVTVAQFKAFVNDGGYDNELFWGEALKVDRWKGGKFAGRCSSFLYPSEKLHYDNHPVVGVSWYEAMAYCHWLTEKLKNTNSLSQELNELLKQGWFISLPTEVHWEKAARGGLEIVTKPQASQYNHRLYPWGDNYFLEKANTTETKIRSTSAVGSFMDGSSPYNILDMSGNVWEWCYNKYMANPGDFFEDTNFEEDRSRRGGSWYYDQKNILCSFRSSRDPSYAGSDMGFRCALVHNLDIIPSINL